MLTNKAGKLAVLGLMMCAFQVGLVHGDSVPTKQPGAPITLNVENSTLEDCLTQLTEATGVKFNFQPENLMEDPMAQDPHSVAIEKLQYWPALLKICEAYNITPDTNNYYGRNNGVTPRITLRKGTMTWQKWAISENGSNLVVLDGINHSRSISFQNSESKSDNLNMQMHLLTDPRQLVAYVNYNLEISEAVDENGKSLINPNQGMYYGGGYNSNGGCCWQINSYLNPPAGMGKKLAKLKGSISMQVITKKERWEVKNITTAKNVEKKLGNLTLVVRSLTKMPDGRYDLDVGYTSTAASRDSFGGYRETFNPSSCLLTTEDGTPLSGSGYSGGGNGYHIYFHNRPNNTELIPAKMVVEVPVETKDVKVPVEFHDIVLP